MSKVICDICGTTYPETAQKCPICGCSREENLEELADVEIQPEVLAAYLAEEEIFEKAAQEPEEYEDHRGNLLMPIIMVVLITIALAFSGYLLVRYFLPNAMGTEPTVTTVPTLSTETVPAETTVPTIPCEGLVLTGGVEPIAMEGGYRLLHVRVTPANTTDKLIFTSEDESVVRVNDDGRMTATGEGETYVNITCGQQTLRCYVVVDYSLLQQPTQEQETIPPMTVPQITEETLPPTEAAEEDGETTPEETQETTAPLKDVVLKLKKTDISLGVGYSYTIPLDCSLSYEEIEWSVEEPSIVRVENGTIKALRKGVTDVVAKYGDQVVECRVRCS